MFVFECVGCGAALTVPLSRVTLPVHAHQKYGNGIQLPVLMESGTFAVEAEPSGPPWRLWEEVDPEEAAARGIHAPVPALSDGPPGAVVIAPGDARGTLLIPEKAGGYCCGLDGADGPNMACEACGLPVASRIDDCSLWQAVWLSPNAVRRRRVGDSPPLSWPELMETAQITRPFELIAAWGSISGTYHWWSWSPEWEAAAGRALAHLLAASEGRPVTVPDGLTAEVFRRALDAFLPAGPMRPPADPPTLRVVLAGPECPAPDSGADFLLVPVHPQTGELWTRPGGRSGAATVAPTQSSTQAPTPVTPAARPVPLPFGVWRWLVFPEPSPPLLISGGKHADILREDPPVPRPGRPFRMDPGAFRHTLARLPAARSPWLREILADLVRHMQAGIF
ncbi:hypothetical protein E4N62_42195 [Streptomyces sp. MNU76]|uniref:hypothetical protein n=1 Tax=Streptomyces sp. MNU76 TaxID=2560026 RepID=UPI001E4DD0DA|nr:hypothetical protein [Streptomyces sp. MNU76]MCC9711262.1 hypothetical protein [Streptomyces sp. MNU76]